MTTSLPSSREFACWDIDHTGFVFYSCTKKRHCHEDFSSPFNSIACTLYDKYFSDFTKNALHNSCVGYFAGCGCCPQCTVNQEIGHHSSHEEAARSAPNKGRRLLRWIWRFGLRLWGKHLLFNLYCPQQYLQKVIVMFSHGCLSVILFTGELGIPGPRSLLRVGRYVLRWVWSGGDGYSLLRHGDWGEYCNRFKK